MRNIRIRQLLSRNREKGASTAIQCTYTARPTTNPMTTREYSPTIVELPQSPRNVTTKHGALPPPLLAKEPVLLLEGDNYRFSASGMARSLYQLTSESTTVCGVDHSSFGRGIASKSLTIEEIYDIGKARKGFVIRQPSGTNLHSNPQRILPFADTSPPISLLLQEIPHEVEQNGAGTGSRTWDCSIAMSAYFASHPDLMFGNVIEIGSGVGLGGILSFLFRSQFPSTKTRPFHSMTLSDCKLQVLNHCNGNVRSFLKSYPTSFPISVAELDWYDVLKKTGSSSEHIEQYDTVIACDCAYEYTDLDALAGTLKALLRKQKTSKAHIFGPTSRGGLHQLVSQLKQDTRFTIHVEQIEMSRYRLDPPREKDSLRSLDALRAITSSSSSQMFTNDGFHSKFDSEFLHVTCSLREGSDATTRKQAPLRDID